VESVTGTGPRGRAHRKGIPNNVNVVCLNGRSAMPRMLGCGWEAIAAIDPDLIHRVVTSRILAVVDPYSH